MNMKFLIKMADAIAHVDRLCLTMRQSADAIDRGIYCFRHTDIYKAGS